MTLSHISLVVGNIEKARKFYLEKLGLPAKSMTENSGIVCVDLGSIKLHLIPRETAPGRPAGEFAFCFEFTDSHTLEKSIAELRSRGLNPVVGPVPIYDGRSLVLYAGSDNERIELTGPQS